MNIVPRVTTPVTADEAKAAVTQAFRTIFRREPKAETELAYLMALVWIETGRGNSVKNNNLGNITASDSYSGNAWRPPWFDLSNDPNPSERNQKLHELMTQGKAPKAFRSYDSLTDGALDFANQLKRSFPEVVEAAGTGNPEAFRDALAIKYSTDYKNTPPQTFESLATEFGAKPFIVVDPPKSRGFVSVRNIVFLSGIAAAAYYGYRHFIGKPDKDKPSQAEPVNKEPEHAE